MKSLKAQIDVLRAAVNAAAAPPTSTPVRCKDITTKWANIRAKINQAYEAGVSQINGLTYNTLGNVWTFESWNDQNGNPFPPEIFKFDLLNPYTPTNNYPPAAAAVQAAPQIAPAVPGENNIAREKLLQCIKEIRKCAITRGYKDPRTGKYMRGKWDMLYAAAVGEAIELARKACEPYASAGGMRRPTTSQKRDFFKAQMASILEGVRSALGPACKPCIKTATPAPTTPAAPAGQ
jgi:hypothetical protein